RAQVILPDGQTVEVSGFHAAQSLQDFVKPMEPRGLGRHLGNPLSVYVRERSGTMAVFLESERFPAGRLLVNDKGRYLDRLGGPERFKRQHSDSSIPQGALPGNCLG